MAADMSPEASSAAISEGDMHGSASSMAGAVSASSSPDVSPMSMQGSKKSNRAAAAAAASNNTGPLGNVLNAHKFATAARHVMTARRSVKAFQAKVGKAAEDFQEEERKLRREATRKFAEVDQNVGFTETIKAADDRLGITERASAADKKYGLSERVQKMRQDLVENAEGLTEKAQQVLATKAGQRPNILNEINKAMFNKITSLGPPRQIMSALDPKALSFCDVRLLPGVAGYVGLTIDDAPCRARDANMALLGEMQALLAKHEATATFFLCTDFVPGHEEALVRLLRDGHEVANHMGADRPYGADEEADFEKLLLASEKICDSLRKQAVAATETSPSASSAFGSSPDPCSPAPSLRRQVSPEASPRRIGLRRCGSGDGLPELRDGGCPFLPPQKTRWFRAPHADASPQMHRVLARHGFTNVLCDAFANDTVINDASFIANALLELVDLDGGSIVVIHTPEKGFREHNLKALRLFLEGLDDMGLVAVSLSGLMEVAREGGYMPPL